MKKNPLDAIGYIDDKLIEKAETYTGSKRRNPLIKWAVLAACILLVFAVAAPKKGEAGNNYQGPLKVTERENADYSGFSAEQRQQFGNLVGEFFLDCFKGKEDLKLPESMKDLYVDNDEMYYVVRRQQYLIDAIVNVWEGSGQIKNLDFQEIVLKNIRKMSSDHVQVTAYVKLNFVYTDDPTHRQSGVGAEVIATLVKTGEGRWLIEDFAEHSGEYDGMKEDYQIFCRKEEQNGITEPRELIDRYFSNRLAELEEIVKEAANKETK